MDTQLTTLSDKEFQQFKSWLYDVAGINLAPSKKALVAGRLSKRLRHYELDSFAEYFSMIMLQAHEAELQLALDLLTTNETYFFREPKHFDYLGMQILPSAAPGKTFRVWCGASSSGEEPYTLAMVLAEKLVSTPWEIVASDISLRVLEQARKGHYGMERAEDIPQHLLGKYCLKGTRSQHGTFLIERSLREKVKFMQINLNAAIPDIGEFDVIFLRNVMIYFDSETKRKVLSRVLPKLKRGGYFFVSHSESLNGVDASLKLVMPSIYIKP